VTSTAAQSYTDNISLNINLNGLANNAVAVSDAYDNTTNGFLTMEIQFSITTNLATTDFSTPTTRTPYVNLYILRSVDGGVTYDDADPNNAELLRVQWTRAASSNAVYQYIGSVLMDSVPQYFKLMIQNLTSTHICLAHPKAIITGPDGNLWITDGFEQRLWEVTTAGAIDWHTNPTDVTFGLGPATNVTLGDITVGSDGNLWVPDFYNTRVWEITTTPTFTPYAPITTRPVAVTYSPSDNNMWMADALGYVWRVTLAGATTPFLLSPGAPLTGICFSNITGDLWVSASDGLVWNVTTAGAATSYLIGGTLTGICEGSDSNLWASDSTGNVWQITTGGVGTSFSLLGGTPTCICAGPDANLWLGDPASGGQVWQVTTAGTPTSFSVTTSVPTGICSGPDGNLWMSSSDGFVWKITTAGTPTAYALVSSIPSGICSGPDGNLWVSDEGPFGFGQVWKVTTGGVGTSYFVVSSPLPIPKGIASDGSDLWIADYRNHAVKVTTSGTTTFYSLIPFINPNKICESSDGDIWMALGLFPFIFKLDITTGEPLFYVQLATATTLWDMCDGPDGNLWVADGNATVWEITTAGTVSSYALTGATCYGICSGPDGNLWVADGASRVWKVTTAGTPTSYSTVGYFPRGICEGSDGNLWVTDATDKVLKINTSGTVLSVYTLTGANLNDTTNITGGPDSNLWVNDYNGKVWKLTTSGTSTPYTLTMDTAIIMSGKTDFYS